MSRPRPLRWYQQLRWRLPAIYLVLVVAPMALLLGVGFAMDASSYKKTYVPETFLSQVTAKAPRAADLLGTPPVSPVAAAILLEDLNQDVLATNRLNTLRVYSDPSVASALLDASGRVLATASEGATPSGPPPADGASAQVAAALAGETDPAKLVGQGPDASYVVAVPARDASGRVAGALVTRVRAPYVLAVHARKFIGFVWGPVGTQILLAVLLAAIVGVVVGRSTAARFERISAATDRWGSGDLSVAIDDHSSDELGQLAARLDRMASELRRVVALRQELATVEERQRIARDLHDSVKQQMFALTMQLGAAQVTLGAERPDVANRLAETEKLAHSVQQELIAMIRELQPPAREGKPFAEVLREYAADWARQSGIAAEVRVSLPDPLPPAVEHALFRVAQEALANVLRHSGASRVTIELAVDEPGRAVLTIADDGRGFDAASRPSGLGLGNMRARIEELPGGRFGVASADGRGARIEASYDTNGTYRRS